MTWGAWTMPATVAAVIAPPAVAMNLRRSVITLSSSPRHELVVGTFGDVVPRPHQRLELGERGVHLPGHRRLLGFLPGDLGGELLELAQHGGGNLNQLDLALELRLEHGERARVPGVVIREPVHLNACRSMVEDALQIGGERLVRLLVEGELAHAPRLVPARVVVVPRGLVKPQLHVVVRPGPFGGVDDPALQRRVDIGSRSQHRRTSRFDIDLAAEPRADTHLESFEVAHGHDLPAEPPGHLGGGPRTLARHQVVGRIALLPELSPVTLVIPGRHALGVHAEWDGAEPLDRGVLPVRRPVVRHAHECLDLSLGSGVKALEGLHDLTGCEKLDTETSATRFLYELGELLGGTLELVERRRPGSGHSPLDLRLSDDVRSVGDGRSHRGHRHAAGGRNEPASCRSRAAFDQQMTLSLAWVEWLRGSGSGSGSSHALALLTPPRAAGRHLRPRYPRS